jgi:hypothetical protein
MPTVPTGPATRAHPKTTLAARRLMQDADPIPQAARFPRRSHSGGLLLIPGSVDGNPKGRMLKFFFRKDRLANDPSKEIFVVCEADVATVRGMVDAAGGRLFSVYDQTVRRLDPDNPPVSTHANIFLRLPPPKTPDRTRLRKDHAGQLIPNPIDQNPGAHWRSRPSFRSISRRINTPPFTTAFHHQTLQ